MRKTIVVAVTVLVLCGHAGAVNVLEPGYTVQTYSSYVDSGIGTGSMTFDNAGNLYMVQFGNSKLWRITPNKTAGILASGFDTTSGIEWTGGTGYGNFLYTTSNTTLKKVGTDGSVSSFASGLPGASEAAVDRTGHYGGNLYVSTGSQDHIYSVSTTGVVSLWSNWPGSADSGGPVGIDFDTSGSYNGAMYVATSFDNQIQSYRSGLFVLDTAGNATRFSSGLAKALEIGFDTEGLFGNLMYVIGTEGFDSNFCIWKVSSNGTLTKFATTSHDGYSSLVFGSDGAMYVSEYLGASGTITVSRIVPEPASLILFGLGAFSILRRKK
jgi:hypothetical protein